MKIAGLDIPLAKITPPILIDFVRKKHYPEPLRQFIHPSLDSYSQYQEDLIMDSIFRYKEKGIFIDVGANDPVELNNTYRFYKRGWRGVNIEPNPIYMPKLRSVRAEDVNLNIGVSGEEGELTFYEVDPPTLSSFNKEAVFEGMKKHGHARLKDTYPVKVMPLKKVIASNLAGKEIDLLSIDAEGYEIDILESNDWDLYLPRVILIEMNHSEKAKIASILNKHGYELVYTNTCNGIFRLGG